MKINSWVIWDAMRLMWRHCNDIDKWITWVYKIADKTVYFMDWFARYTALSVIVPANVLKYTGTRPNAETQCWHWFRHGLVRYDFAIVLTVINFKYAFHDMSIWCNTLHTITRDITSCIYRVKVIFPISINRLVLKSEYSRMTMLMPRLLMPCLLANIFVRSSCDPDCHNGIKSLAEGVWNSSPGIYFYFSEFKLQYVYIEILDPVCYPWLWWRVAVFVYKFLP